MQEVWPLDSPLCKLRGSVKFSKRNPEPWLGTEARKSEVLTTFSL